MSRRQRSSFWTELRGFVHGTRPEELAEFLAPKTDPWIIRALQSPHVKVRELAHTIVLNSAYFPGSDAVTALVRLLRDERGDVRLGILRAVNRLTDVEFGERLAEWWDISNRGKECTPAVMAVIDRLSDPVDDVRVEATLLLVKLSAVFKAEPSLAAPLISGPAKFFVEEASTGTSGELRQAAAKLRYASVSVGGRQGLYVAQLLKSDQPETQLYVLNLLRDRPGTADELKYNWSREEIVQAIVDCSGSRSADVRQAAAKCYESLTGVNLENTIRRD